MEHTMSRPAGFIIDVPVTLSVSVRGASLAEAKQIARIFADGIAPTEAYITGYNAGSHREGNYLPEVKITDVGFESSLEDECDLLDKLEADDEDYD
jgi:hypothetical protein